MTTRREFLGQTLATGGLLVLPGLLRAEPAPARTPSAAATPEGSGGVGAGEHQLPPLPYAYDALEPYIDAQTMMLHHDKHHLAYVTGLNAAEKALVEARAQGRFDDIETLMRQVAFFGSGHYNHVVYWNNMRPAAQAKPRPEGALLQRIEHDFGSFDAGKAQLTAAAVKVEGNGWGVLAWHPGFGSLVTLAFMNHQNSLQSAALPLLVCDTWEHAYYLKYQNRRADYVAAWWKVVDWANVEQRFAAARGLVL
ncbi:MAG: superoxide dismutase [Candidatus Krumholzibacteriia bacterium]